METEFRFFAIAARGSEKSDVCASTPPGLVLPATNGAVVQLSAPGGRQLPRLGEEGLPFSLWCRDETVNEEACLCAGGGKRRVGGGGAGGVMKVLLWPIKGFIVVSYIFRAYSGHLLPL